MKIKDIEKLLVKSADNVVPNVLPNVLSERVVVEQTPTVVKKSRFNFRRLIGFAVALVILVTGTFVVDSTVLCKEDQTVYIEVNPSVEVVLDKMSRIISITCSDEQVLQQINKLDLVGKSFNNASEQIIKTMQSKIDSKSIIYISLSKKDGEVADKQLSKYNEMVQKTLQKYNINCKLDVTKLTEQDKIDIQQYAVTPAKLKLLKDIQGFIDGSTLAQLAEKYGKYNVKGLNEILDEIKKAFEHIGGGIFDIDKIINDILDHINGKYDKDNGGNILDGIGK